MDTPIIKQIKNIQFKLLSPEEIKKIAAAKIITPELYDVDGYPVDGGLMDLRLGAIDPGVRCRTCGGTLKECLGHPGYIELARPVIHIDYIQIIEIILKSYCSFCGKFLLKEEDIKKHSLADRIKKAKNVKKCPYCQTEKEKIKLEKPTTFMLGKKRIFPNEIREILEKIPDEELKYVGINPNVFRPEWAVLTLLLIPPVTVRPSITLETGERSEDDLTHKISDIIRANQRLWENLNAGAPEVIIEDLWDLLQYHVTTFFNNNIAGIPPARHRSGQPLKTIEERIKGKEGRIRHNLTGKRVNFSSRSVISPDPFLKINEIGIPHEVAEIVTVPEMVNSLNINRLKEIIKNDSYPSANYVIRPDGKRKKITKELKEEILEELKEGYIVERHLQDGDIVLFNRQPSLHRPSIMAHIVRVLPYKTFRLHPAVCHPYNADFDGDEMNVHSPQTEEAKAEAKILLEVSKNLISPKNNVNLFGCAQDSITGNYLLTSEDEIERDVAMQLLYKSNKEEKISKKNLSGKEIFSKILPKINFETKTKSCLGDSCPYYDKCKKQNCPYNSYLKIENGNLISGLIDKNTFGLEDGTLIKILDKEVGREETIKTIEKIFRLGTGYLMKKGFSIGIEDLKINEEIEKANLSVIKEAEEKVNKYIEDYYNDTIELIPGKTKEESREIKIIQALNEVRTRIGKVVKEKFDKNSPVNIMILSGAGGNILNIVQVGCVIGQQSLWAKRIEIGYTNRTLSFFKKNDLSPKARGFIYSNYKKGLTPIEFFFGAMTGRDSLMDTALRTPKSGYLYRRLANSLQDFKIAYDLTVRDASDNIVQFEYGEDGKDVSLLHLNKKISPGEAIGLVTAQSFGEPSTQMALNVFHFAGVQEMQITTGLPRLIEIIDARKLPSTPQMEIYLENEFNNEKDARVIAEKIKEVKLKEIAKEIKINFSDKKIEIHLDKEKIKSIHSSIEKIIERINEKGFKVKLKEEVIYTSNPNFNFTELYKLKEKLKECVISGVPGITQILIVKRDKNYVILTAGTNLKKILEIKGINKEKTITNNIYEIEEIFGIEAARNAIINEIKKVVNSQGLDIDERHIKMVADAMTYKGSIKGTTRLGIISEKSSILAKASFETPIKHFVNATIKGNKDELASVTENIMLNQPVPVGTGLPGLLVKITGSLAKDKQKEK
ncbi:MAG: DNA-directed RNA polymerase subunit A' [Candidatus Pacearchaeota archaeon]